jgi:hypothetical protein
MNMSGVVLYKYIVNLNKPSGLGDIDNFISLSEAFIKIFDTLDMDSCHKLAAQLCDADDKKRKNIDIMSDVFVTGEELLLRLDSSKIRKDLKDYYKKKIAVIVINAENKYLTATNLLLKMKGL